MSADSISARRQIGEPLDGDLALTAQTRDGDSWLSLTREDFAALASAHRRAQLPMVLGIVPVPAAAFSAYGLLVRWPAMSLWLALGTGVAVGGALFIVAWRWERQRLRERTLACPQCAAWLLPPHALRGDEARVQLITASGACPSCGATLFVPPSVAS
jgi:hypothetical protein